MTARYVRKYKGATPLWAMTPSELLLYFAIVGLFFLFAYLHDIGL